MTIDQMRVELVLECNKHNPTCHNGDLACPLDPHKPCNFESMSDEMVKERYYEAFGKPPVTEDTVNHPNHYNREGSMECIDEMVTIFGKEAVKNFCLCNVWKYRYRAADKNGIEDLKKSDWYMNKYKELITSE